MGLLDKLTTGQSNLTGLNGATPEVAEFSISKLHDTYSADGTPIKYGAFRFNNRP